MVVAICLTPAPAKCKAARPRRSRWALLVALLLAVPAGCNKESTTTAAPGGGHPTAQPAAKPLSASGQLQLTPGDRCPVCGMMVTKHEKLASGIALKDGTTFHFCGTGCLLKSWLHPEIFLGHPRSSLARAVTREYFAGEYIDAKTARFVAGSDVVGPMGPAIVPLKNDADLATFKKRHGSKIVFRLAELNDTKWQAITGKPAARPAGGMHPRRPGTPKAP